MKVYTLFAIAAMLLVMSCGQSAHENYMTDLNALLKTDREASALSEQQGMKAAMLASMDDSCVLLRNNNMPLKGNDAKKHLSEMGDSNFTITWEPQTGYVAASGEMGYTYGVYTMRMKTDGKTTQGTYATIWSRQKDGKWKMMLDTGNDGLAPTHASPDSTK